MKWRHSDVHGKWWTEQPVLQTLHQNGSCCKNNLPLAITLQNWLRSKLKLNIQWYLFFPLSHRYQFVIQHRTNMKPFYYFHFCRNKIIGLKNLTILFKIAINEKGKRTSMGSKLYFWNIKLPHCDISYFKYFTFWHADTLQMNAEDFLERLRVLQGLWEKETAAFDTAMDALMVKTANICSYSSQWTEVTATFLRKPYGIFSLTIFAIIIEFIIISMPENMSHSTRGALGRPKQ